MAKYHEHYERVTWANGATALSAEHMNNIESGISDLIDYKVEKETGKGLYPDADKTKLAGIEAGAQVNRTYTAVTGKPTAAASPAFGGTVTVSQVTQDANGQVSVTDRVITIPSADATTSAHGLMSVSDKIKLNKMPDDPQTIGYETLTFSNVYPNSANYRTVSKNNISLYKTPISLVITSITGTNANLIDIVSTVIEQTDSYGDKFKVKLLLAPSGSSETVSATVTAKLFYYE